LSWFQRFRGRGGLALAVALLCPTSWLQRFLLAHQPVSICAHLSREASCLSRNELSELGLQAIEQSLCSKAGFQSLGPQLPLTLQTLSTLSSGQRASLNQSELSARRTTGPWLGTSLVRVFPTAAPRAEAKVYCLGANITYPEEVYRWS
jgi:hypothetical protein